METENITASSAKLLSVSRSAMNGEFEVMFPRQRFSFGLEAAISALDEVERIERILSVFRFDSRVQYVNLTANENAVQVDEEFFELLVQCRAVAEATGGAVDITSGRLWKLWGFAKRQGLVPSESEVARELETVGYKFLELDVGRRTVRFLRGGMELNFGCVGKGFALDVASVRLREFGVDRFIFHGGLSSILACGEGWRIGAADPIRSGQRLGEIVLSNNAVSTSSSQKQFFRHKGHRYSHLIDPRTGFPAEGVFSVTVIAPTATLAELLSTAFFVMGIERATDYQKKHPEIAAIFVLPTNKKTTSFEIKTIGQITHQ
ncbi:MAG: FAD:protein FMN transferase [Planctomycetaceae bacterium]|jgi:thiamine biosynthesis lipoprotein|nr:FAD:protein FMN transferase [Planctomycetaceae bacterium]